MPAAGSGSTGIACVQEGFIFTGIEEIEKNCRIAELRIAYWKKQLSPQIKMEL